jgi:hypothetical protein
MARLETYTCDECPAIKRETNRWFNVTPTIECVTGRPVLILAGHVHPLPKPGTKTFCGIECVQKFVSKWMAGLSEKKD